MNFGDSEAIHVSFCVTIEDASVLIVIAQQISTDGMSKTEREDYDACVTKARVHFVDGESGGGSFSLEAPPDEIIEEFFGDEGLPMPDPDLSWTALLRGIR